LKLLLRAKQRKNRLCRQIYAVLDRRHTYYQAQPESPEDSALMRRIDEPHLEMPYAGARMLSRMLKREGRLAGSA